MVRPQSADLTGLTVLALLMQGPRHPYELHRLIVDTHKDYITGLPRSLYHAVDRLMNDELIVPVETSREGRRPERTVYQITADGRAELAARLRGLLERTDSAPPTFTAAVSLLGCLPVEEAVRSLGTRVTGLEGRIATLDGVMETLRTGGLPRLLLLELEYARATTAAELQWVRGLLADIRVGDLTWTSPLTGADLRLRPGSGAATDEEEQPEE
ncbi:Transcriptional regulator PadR-like family protein [Actinopolymorpha cephalotaxi]|uniref:DNA-binding PadR family transcriptional regulator n=1 Tax=Actinopolymorpha cephalotaxi TaxID=504797 RepID=A0A1I2T286_9ACTN|nr:helix-turn-helix transcriptional regulator [Actinopolymorpha cephalotaxi]NYH82913.1 DNA-binding PadR family transcriptional regulator [Actinopolymorpha cephalotaxi]SFG59174.1 Transcriptional regulator PadR-like family protein [Actinopolymorpha cephalotaxi]